MTGSMKLYNYDNVTELHLHLIILSKISIQMSHTTHKKINSSLSLLTDHIVIQ